VVKSACEDAVECDVEAESGCETEAEAEGGKKKKGKRQD